MNNYNLLVNLLREPTIPNSLAFGVNALKAEFEQAVFLKVAFTPSNGDFKVSVPLNQALASLFNTKHQELIDAIKSNFIATISEVCPDIQIKSVNVLKSDSATITFNVIAPTA